MIRVLFIIPNAMDRGGIETFAITYFKHMNSKEFKFMFCQLSSENKGVFDDYILENGGEVSYITTKSNRIKALKKELSNVICEFKPDIVHVHGDVSCTRVYIALYLLKMKNVIAHSHNTSSLDKSFLLPIKKFLAKKLSSVHMACSIPAGKWLFGNSIKKSNFYFIHNAIETSKFVFNESNRVTIRSKYHIADDCLLIGCVGHLIDSHKNQRFLINLLSKMNNGSKLMLIGGGRDIEMLKSFAKMNDVFDNVIFVGSVQDTSPYYSAFDVFCLPSHFEGISIACIEAIANGLSPIVSNNVPIASGFEKRETALEIDNGGFYIWIKAIKQSQKAKRIKDDTVLKNGFDIESESLRLEQIYKKMVGQS